MSNSYFSRLNLSSKHRVIIWLFILYKLRLIYLKIFFKFLIKLRIVIFFHLLITLIVMCLYMSSNVQNLSREIRQKGCFNYESSANMMCKVSDYQNLVTIKCCDSHLCNKDLTAYLNPADGELHTYVQQYYYRITLIFAFSMYVYIVYTTM